MSGVVLTIIVLVIANILMAAWIISLHAKMDDFFESMLEEDE